MHMGVSVYGGRVYLCHSDSGGVDLHVISVDKGDLIGKFQVPAPDKKRTGFPPGQDPLVIGENLVLLVDTKGSLLGIDCSSLSVDNPHPSLVFCIECGDAGIFLNSLTYFSVVVVVVVVVFSVVVVAVVVVVVVVGLKYLLNCFKLKIISAQENVWIAQSGG
jgi:hypothetical protein